MSEYVPTYDDVLSAAQTLQGEAVRTPLMRCDALDAATGCKVFVKPENLQRTGSFKFRGAFNAISKLTDQDRDKGVLASSSGNHAQGVGEASRLFGCSATIVMPADAPAMKVKRTKALGAKVVHFDRASEDRDVKLGGVVIHPFNNAMVIAGQGTVGLEIAEDMKAAELQLDRMVACTGGGGLTSGIALSIKHHFPEAKIHSVEPVGFDDYKRSLDSGKLECNATTAGSICDAIIAPMPGAIGFEINKNLLNSGLVVSDEEALAAIRFAYEELKLVVEPGGAVALAAVLKHGKEWAGETIAIVLSGGNIDPDVFVRAIS
ncbi:L-threo-3-hydroxyaspartate ammonia-lyase [Nymphon striatum]|nr:L-threo-3-hydroxyaspartate ammonia-lyase [Nymphon striatum]